MRSKTLVAFLVLTCGLWSGLQVLSAASAAETPAVVVPAPEFEFKPVPDGAEVRHDFVFKNTGTGLLKIESVKTA